MISENSSKGQPGLSVTFLILAVTFSVCLVVSNFFVPRIWQLGGSWMQLTGAVVIFPISYIINDLLTEVYGYKRAMMVIWLGFAMSLFVGLMCALVTSLPAPVDAADQQRAVSFNNLLTSMPRTTIASLTAYILGSHMNAWIMSRMKIKSQGKGFGWRAVISTVLGELIDSLVFYPLAFLGMMPIKTIMVIIFTQVCTKTLYEVLVLPVTSALSKKLKEVEQTDTYDYDVTYNPFKLSGLFK